MLIGLGTQRSMWLIKASQGLVIQLHPRCTTKSSSRPSHLSKTSLTIANLCRTFIRGTRRKRQNQSLSKPPNLRHPRQGKRGWCKEWWHRLSLPRPHRINYLVPLTSMQRKRGRCLFREIIRKSLTESQHRKSHATRQTIKWTTTMTMTKRINLLREGSVPSVMKMNRRRATR